MKSDFPRAFTGHPQTGASQHIAIMLLEVVIFIVTSCISVFIFDEISHQVKSDLPRIGKNPGPFNLFKWWARWDWLQRGHEDIKRAYTQVRQPMKHSRESQTRINIAFIVQHHQLCRADFDG